MYHNILFRLSQLSNNNLILETNCCEAIKISFKGQWLPYHKHYEGTYHMISSRPLLYKNNKLQLYVTKEVFGRWVVSLVKMKVNKNSLAKYKKHSRKELVVNTLICVLNRSVLSMMEVFQFFVPMIAMGMEICAQISVNGRVGVMI